MSSRDNDDLQAVQTFALLQTLPVSVAEIDTFLQELAELAGHLTSPPVSCGITVQYDGRPLTVSSSDARARALDQAQYETDVGPRLEAMRTGVAVYVPDPEAQTRWPGYLEAARSLGLQASLSLPLIVDGTSVGAVNFYSTDPAQTLDGDVRVRADLFAAQASTALLLAMRQLQQNETNRQLEVALSSRSVIDQAMGIIMGQQRCTAEQAFDLLRIHSQNNNRPLREVAADLVARRSASD